MSQLILIEKDDERISVHPGTLENHIKLGWKVVDQAALKEAKQEKAAEIANDKPVRQGKR